MPQKFRNKLIGVFCFQHRRLCCVGYQLLRLDRKKFYRVGLCAKFVVMPMNSLWTVSAKASHSPCVV